MILATPEPDRNDNNRMSLRMSMIASAMVFTPRPSQDPRENLRTLQSPLKPNYSTPLKPTNKEEPEEDIVLVETNHPNVVQDDEDNLVILESVQAPIPLETPRRFVQFTPQPHQYQTPRRDPRNSLHRAVLIRSAQRTAMRIEMQLEEEQEEMEVEDVVTELEETNLEDNTPEEVRMRSVHLLPSQRGLQDDGDETTEVQTLERQEATEEQDILRPLGPFMTPQPSSVRASSVLSNQSGLSVQGPQRVRVTQLWKVKDIVVPTTSETSVKKEDPEPREQVSEEERSVSVFVVLLLSRSADRLPHQQAIRARRKSAFTIPDPADSQIPGSRRMSTILHHPTTTPSVPSPKKPLVKPDPNPPEEEEDTDVLLEKVKAKIEDLKRRQSIGLGPPPLARQRSRSPTKQDAEALFWGSDNVISTRIDKVGGQGGGSVDDSQPQGEDENMEEQEVIQQTTPVKSRGPPKIKPPPKTPRMDGMKGLFADPKAVPSTPAMGGIKQLFNKPVEPPTPLYSGVRDMFEATVAPVVPPDPPTRVTRGRTTPTPVEDGGTVTTVTKKPNSSSNLRTNPRRGTRTTPVPDEDQPGVPTARKKPTRGKRVETIKEEDDVPPQTTTQKGPLTRKTRLQTPSHESPTEKENDPSDSGENVQSQGAPQTRTRRTATKTPAVKAEKATTARPTRVTRSKK